MRLARTVCRTTRRSTGGRGLGPDALQCVGPVMAGYAHGAEQVGRRNGHSRPLAIRNRRSSAEHHARPDRHSSSCGAPSLGHALERPQRSALGQGVSVTSLQQSRRPEADSQTESQDFAPGGTRLPPTPRFNQLWKRYKVRRGICSFRKTGRVCGKNREAIEHEKAIIPSN